MSDLPKLRIWERSSDPQRAVVVPERCGESASDATYELISITAWMAGDPDPLLATNFAVPESVFAKF